MGAEDIAACSRKVRVKDVSWNRNGHRYVDGSTRSRRLSEMEGSVVAGAFGAF
jgi:hypothetical protein